MQCKKHNCKGLVASAGNFSQTVFLSHSRGPNRFARDAEIQHFPAMPTAPEFSAFIVRAGAKGKRQWLQRKSIINLNLDNRTTPSKRPES